LNRGTPTGGFLPTDDCELPVDCSAKFIRPRIPLREARHIPLSSGGPNLTRLSSLFRRDGHEIVPAARVFLSGERADEFPPSWRVSDPLNGRERSPLRIYAWPQIFAERFCEVAVREAVSACRARIRLPRSNHRISPIPLSAIDWNRLEEESYAARRSVHRRVSECRNEKKPSSVSFTSLTTDRRLNTSFMSRDREYRNVDLRFSPGLTFSRPTRHKIHASYTLGNVSIFSRAH